MQGKIEQADASELVQGLMSPAPSEAFSIFRPQENGTVKEFRVRVRLLKAEQNIAALKAAQEYAKRMGESSADYGDIYKEAQAYELVARCLCHPEKIELRAPDQDEGVMTLRPIFVDSDQVRASFTEKEVAAVLNCYEVVKAKFACLDSFDPEDVDEWAAKLSDTLLGPYFLSQLDSDHWLELLMQLARRVSSLSEKAGQPLPSWRDFSESAAETSDPGTSGSISSATVQSSDGETISDGKMLTRDDAKEIVKKRRTRKK